MKYLKMLGLAAIAAMALMAFFGASSASATVLCTTKANPCGAGWDLASGAKLEASLKSGTEAVLRAGFAQVKCTKSAVNGEVTDTGGKGKEVKGKVTSLTFEECKCGERVAHVTTLNNGELSVADAGGTKGTVTGYNQSVTIRCTGLAHCVFGTAAAGTDLGTFESGHPAILKASANVPWNSTASESGTFTCVAFGPHSALWTAEYQVTNHTQLYVEPE